MIAVVLNPTHVEVIYYVATDRSWVIQVLFVQKQAKLLQLPFSVFLLRCCARVDSSPVQWVLACGGTSLPGPSLALLQWKRSNIWWSMLGEKNWNCSAHPLPPFSLTHPRLQRACALLCSQLSAKPSRKDGCVCGGVGGAIGAVWHALSLWQGE